MEETPFKQHGEGDDDDGGASGVGGPATMEMKETKGEHKRDNRQVFRSITWVKCGTPRTLDLQTSKTEAWSWTRGGMKGGCRRRFPSQEYVVRRSGRVSLTDLTSNRTGPAEVWLWRRWAEEARCNREPPGKHEIEDIFDQGKVTQAVNGERDLELERTGEERGQHGDWSARRQRAVALPASRRKCWGGSSIIGTGRKY